MDINDLGVRLKFVSHPTGFTFDPKPRSVETFAEYLVRFREEMSALLDHLLYDEGICSNYILCHPDMRRSYLCPLIYGKDGIYYRFPSISNPSLVHLLQLDEKPGS